MRGQDFIDLAIDLARRGSEAAHRTAASRAYYGAFHVAVQLLADTGIELPDSAEAHRKVRFCLGECRESAGEQAGERLELLRHRRNSADYNLHETAFQEKALRKRPSFWLSTLSRYSRRVAPSRLGHGSERRSARTRRKSCACRSGSAVAT